MRNPSVFLGQHFTGFIEAQVQDGCHGSASDVIRAGLRLLEEHESKVKALQDALDAGLESGAPRLFDSDAFLRRMHARNGQAVPAVSAGEGRSLRLHAPHGQIPRA
ncbi:type II toxin-antitoxin system ParD family antitoxin [Comamonas sp. NLF-1-9]|uniref:type II toxin-antitoxin system ParD family antitoxin n=1 Tax=Comamonas sp. NLF-1-9 TaxID=2853163 RepID=UPI001C488F3B|nr:type II toxin-antitoxin system ParD family antitoxin [Comamonas sp. NLF-1-9]